MTSPVKKTADTPKVKAAATKATKATTAVKETKTTKQSARAAKALTQTAPAKTRRKEGGATNGGRALSTTATSAKGARKAAPKTANEAILLAWQYDYDSRHARKGTRG